MSRAEQSRAWEQSAERRAERRAQSRAQQSGAERDDGHSSSSECNEPGADAMEGDEHEPRAARTTGDSEQQRAAASAATTVGAAHQLGEDLTRPQGPGPGPAVHRGSLFGHEPRPSALTATTTTATTPFNLSTERAIPLDGRVTGADLSGLGNVVDIGAPAP